MFINLLLEKYSFSLRHGHLCANGMEEALSGTLAGRLAGWGSAWARRPPQSSEVRCEAPRGRERPGWFMSLER